MKQVFDIKEILDLLPHRYPFVLVDRVLSVEPGVTIRALKNVTINEPFFQGHFPDRPIMPGVLILEGMVQTAGLLMAQELSMDARRRLRFTGIDGARFRKPVVPGDQLIFEVGIVKQRSRVVKMNATAFVDNLRVAEAKIMVLTGGEL
ncbi:MAG: 3-hydroxyacyl-[acyl-carrier-protein] dehydratase FabZ [Desulfobacteraceae bacterium]|nr:MAG: 3-hydroxyacyl-[acyl-carrier-protein] dehydratase FabZ [Desulfobacteraceae bacterium]